MQPYEFKQPNMSAIGFVCQEWHLQPWLAHVMRMYHLCSRITDKRGRPDRPLIWHRNCRIGWIYSCLTNYLCLGGLESSFFCGLLGSYSYLLWGCNINQKNIIRFTFIRHIGWSENVKSSHTPDAQNQCRLSLCHLWVESTSIVSIPKSLQCKHTLCYNWRIKYPMKRIV